MKLIVYLVCVKFSTCAKWIRLTCTYERVRNVSFSENLVYVLKEWSVGKTSWKLTFGYEYHWLFSSSSMGPFERLVWEVWMPHIRSAVGWVELFFRMFEEFDLCYPFSETLLTVKSMIYLLFIDCFVTRFTWRKI